MATAGEKTKRLCPNCGSKEVCRSRRHGAVESLLHVLRIVPFRCEDCYKRFFRRET